MDDIDLPLKETGISVEIIYNGVVIEQNLRQMNRDGKWLHEELKSGI